MPLQGSAIAKIMSNSPSSLPLPPGRSGWPVVGESIRYLRDPEGFIAQRQQQYGNCFKTHLFGRPAVVLIGAEAVQFLFANEGTKLEMTNTPNFEALLGNQSIGVQVGVAHQVLRRQLFQAFQPRALESYAATMSDMTRRYLREWVQRENLTWYDELKKYTLDIACQLFIGVSTTANVNLPALYETWSRGLLSPPIKFPGSPLAKALQAREQLLAEFDQLIEQHSAADPAVDCVSQPNVLSLLLAAKDENGNALSRAAIKDNLLAMLIAGHETLTSALTSLCQLLAQHPTVLEALRAEQARLGNPVLTQETLKQMTYLEQVLKEGLRLLPPVVRSGSRRVLEACEFGGYRIEPGWDLHYQIPETHQDASIYTHPEQFDPDRFSPQRAEDKQKTFSHIPFGGGIRECLGKEFARLEMKIFAALLVRDYQWEILPSQDLTRTVIPFSRPKDGLRAKLRPLSASF